VIQYIGPRARTVDLTPEEYLNDASWFKTPSLNASTAHLLVSESPLHAFAQHPRLGGVLKRSNGTKPMNAGAVIHKLMLGKGRDIAVIDARDFRTDAAKEARDAAIAADKIPILRHDFDHKAAAAGLLLERCRAEHGITFHGESELIIEWIDECADGPVRCRSMLDHAFVEDGIILEVKSGASVNPRDIDRHFIEYGYDLAYTAYTRALARLRPEFEGRIDMRFIFVELEPPYSIVVRPPGGAAREIGALRWERAVQLWRRCLDSGEWPGYPNGVGMQIEPPTYVVTQELGTWQP
jgi:PDDEXK-like uncharacterized protein DUF3799